MQSVFLKLIEQLNSSVFILLLMLVAAGYVMHRLGRWQEKFCSHDSKMKGLDKLNNDFIELKTKVDLIYYNTNPNAMVRARSPLSFTPIGQQVVDKIDAKSIFEKYKDRLISAVEQTSPKNAYDIQQASLDISIKYLITLLDSSEVNTIKNEAYARGVLEQDILSLFGILLRDAILQQKGIPVNEVDIHDVVKNKTADS